MGSKGGGGLRRGVILGGMWDKCGRGGSFSDDVGPYRCTYVCSSSWEQEVT